MPCSFPPPSLVLETWSGRQPVGIIDSHVMTCIIGVNSALDCGLKLLEWNGIKTIKLR